MLLRFLHKKHGDKYLHTAIQWVLDIQMFQKALTSSRQHKPQIETDYVDGAVCYNFFFPEISVHSFSQLTTDFLIFLIRWT